MSGIFEEITLGWDGKQYKIPANRVMAAIGVVEKHVTLGELAKWQADPEKLRLTQLTAAYGAIIRFAGATVSDEQIYAGLFQQGGQTQVVAAIQGMLMMMIPPSALAGKADAKKKPVSKKSGS